LKLVVDTNIIPMTLIKRSKARSVLLNPAHEFFFPEYRVEEVERHLPLIMEKTRLSEEEVRLAFRVLMTNLRVVPPGEIRSRLSEAEAIMGSIDESDVPFIAAALSLSCDGIWSDDKDFKRQRKVRVWTTGEMTHLS